MSPGYKDTTRKPKSQSSQWNHSMSPRPKKVCQVHSNVKVTLTAFFDSRDMVHHEYTPQGQTITKEYYRDFLRHLCDAVRHKRPQLWSTGNFCLHHDNAPAHSSHLIQIFLAKIQTPVFRHSTKHYITQMLLVINWRYWQVGKNSRICIKVPGRLMQARFIEIQRVIAKKKSDIFLTDLVNILVGVTCIPLHGLNFFFYENSGWIKFQYSTTRWLEF